MTWPNLRANLYHYSMHKTLLHANTFVTTAVLGNAAAQ
jgi:hypothetical protein